MATKKSATAQAAAAEVTTGTYVVGDCPISHDGDTYQPGSPVELTEAQAKRLGALVAPAAETSKD